MIRINRVGDGLSCCYLPVDNLSGVAVFSPLSVDRCDIGSSGLSSLKSPSDTSQEKNWKGVDRLE